MPVEQPVNSARKCYSVLDHIRPALRHRPNMGCLRLGLATAIDNAKPCDRAPVVVGAANLAAEGGISDFAIDQNLLDPALLLLGWCLQEFASITVELPIIEVKPVR